MTVKYELNTDKLRFNIEKEQDANGAFKYFLIVQDKSSSDTLCVAISEAELQIITKLTANALF